jgi:CRISPR-associated protein Cmr6
MDALFGTTSDAGFLTWHDAWLDPASPPPLIRDVVTVHHPSYYQGSGAPTDFDDPKPIPFLSTRGTYLIAIQGPDREWATFAMELLKRALDEWGIGAKTNAGYGRLTQVETVEIPHQSPSYRTLSQVATWAALPADHPQREPQARKLLARLQRDPQLYAAFIDFPDWGVQLAEYCMDELGIDL